MIRALIGLLLGMLLMGCDDRCPTLPGGTQYCLQAPSTSPVFNVLQRVTFTTPERTDTMLMQIESSPQKLVLAGLTPLGQTLFTMQWDGHRTEASWAPGIKPPIEASTLIALIQMAQWPQNGEPGNIVIQREGKQAPYDRLHIELPDATLQLDIQTLPEEAPR